VQIDIAPIASSPLTSSEYKYELTTKKQKRGGSIPTMIVCLRLLSFDINQQQRQQKKRSFFGFLIYDFVDFDSY
jgi:hypothetical protein